MSAITFQTGEVFKEDWSFVKLLHNIHYKQIQLTLVLTKGIAVVRKLPNFM